MDRNQNIYVKIYIVKWPFQAGWPFKLWPLKGGFAVEISLISKVRLKFLIKNESNFKVTTYLIYTLLLLLMPLLLLLLLLLVVVVVLLLLDLVLQSLQYQCKPHATW